MYKAAVKPPIRVFILEESVFKKFIEWAEINNWNIEISEETKDLPQDVLNRYSINDDWLNFIKHFKLCENSNSTKWFLTVNDYFPVSSGFQWNEFELQSLEACRNDEEWRKSIIEYWNNHFPIFISVDGEYSYYAIDIKNGNVVYGNEPEFEEAVIVADNILTFIEMSITGKIKL